MDAYLYRAVDFDNLTPGQLLVLDYWRSIKGEGIGPSWPTFDLMKLPHHLLPFTHIADVLEESEDFYFRFYGTNLSEIHGAELSGKTTREIRPLSLADAVRASFSVVLTKKAPVTSIAEIDPNNLTTFQVVLRLPLSADGVHVTNVVTVAEYRRSIADARLVMQRILEAEKTAE